MRQREGDVEEFAPASLKGGDAVEFVEVNGGIAVEAGVRAQEVVVGGEEGGESERAVAGIEAAGGASVEAIGTVEAFDELFEGTPLGGLVVEVFEASA